MQQDNNKSLEIYQKELEIARLEGNQYNEANTLINIGQIYSLIGKYEEAKRYFKQSLTLWRAINDRFREGMTLFEIGFACWELRRLDEAIEYMSEAVKVAEAGYYRYLPRYQKWLVHVEKERRAEQG
jgi:tetratricopeptide (TPR) repeat protein